MRTARAGALCGLVLAVVTACSSTTAPQALTIDDVAAERAELAEDRVDTLLQTYEDYLTTRWPGIVLPETSIESWLEQSEWPAAFESCASDAAGRTVRTDATSGVSAIPLPQTAGQMRDFEISIYLCQGRFPPPNLGTNDPGPVEVEWVNSYARVVLPGCLRRYGVVAPPLTADPFAILSGGASPRWDPYLSLRSDAAELQRVAALCPHPLTVLGTLSSVGAPR